MALILNLYSDAQCNTPVLSPVIGVAGITGYYAEKTNWISRTEWGYKFYRAQISNTAGRQGVVLSGAIPIFNFQSIADREIFTAPDTNAITTDTARHNQTTKVYNIVFAGIRTQSGNRLTSNTLNFTGSQSPNWFDFAIRAQQYIQEPLDATGSDRTLWAYNDSGSYFEASAQLIGELQQCVCVYKFPMWDEEFYLFALGVSAGGEPNARTVLFAVPVDFFKDREIKPYVGPVSKDSAAGSFIPVTPWDDSIPSRTISDANPYGFNSGNGLRLTVLPKALYSYIMQGIYTGYSDSYINAASQLIDRVIGGSGHRPADEVRAIVGGVLCCHSVPALTNYVSGLASDIRTICGYRCFPLAAAFPLAGQMIYTLDTARFNLAPRLNSFLDYEPFTAISLHVPFCGMCSLQPSQAYGNDIYLHYVVDIYSGAVSCDVHIAGTTGGQAEYKDYVYTTLQGSFATDMPVMGAGATQSPLQQIAKGVTGITTAQLAANTATGSRAALAAADLKAAKLSAAIGAAETIETAGRGTAIGSASSEGLASYLSNRAVYVIIDRPEPSVPEGYAEMQGIPAHLGGTVGNFGGWTEFEAVDLTSVTQATQAEKEQIILELKAGVFV